MQTNLLPQLFTTTSFNKKNTEVSLEKKYDVLLSVALENNCYNLLRDCVHSWSDGSFSGNLGPTTGLSLSVITEWIWRSATNLEKRCTYLCNGLLENNGYGLDSREQKEMGSLTRQLKLLYDLMGEIISNSKRKIPEDVNNSLEKHMKSLYANTFFYRVVLWLFNIGLLPTNLHNNTTSTDSVFVYNYMELELLYKNRRKFFAKLCKDSILKRTKSCRLLYIDAFIEHECRNSDLYELWSQNNNGNCTYPPRSFGDMLRMLLLPNIEFDSKCIILMYFFLDLHVMWESKNPYKSIEEQFVKFPSVFQLSPSLMKTVQTFWFIDRGCFSPIIDEYISLIKKNQIQSEWLLELLMEILLVKNKADIALRVLQARPVIISPKMKLKALIANDLITEAFHMARTDNTEPLLELFFNYCIETGRYGVVRDLTLNEREGHLLQRLLNSSKIFCAENLQFVYLLSRSKYIEAIAYMDELSKHKELRNSQNNHTIETSQLVLSAFNTTIAPMQQGLTDTYFRIHNKIKQKDVQNKNDPVPLSCQLIKQNANNLLGGIYHSSALSAHFATYNHDNNNIKRKTKNLQDKKTNLFIPNNVPFLRKPQVENIQENFKDKNSISIPQLYRAPNKRHFNEDRGLIQLENATDEYNPPKRLRLLEHKVIDVDFMQNYRKPSKTNNQTEKDVMVVMPEKEPVKKQSSILKRHINQNIKESTISTKKPFMNVHKDVLIKCTNSNRLVDFDMPESPLNLELSYTVNDDDDNDEDENLANQQVVKTVISPKPRKPINHEDNLKDYECMQQHRVVSNVDLLTIANPQHDLSTIDKEVEVAVVVLDDDINQIEEFKPKVSSSKVCETQSRFNKSEKTIENHIKYTECSTIIGTISYDDEISTDNNVNKNLITTTSTITTTKSTAKTLRNNSEINKKEMLETTMDMTSWEEGFLLERDAAINLQEENHAKIIDTQENKEVYFTAMSSNWQNKDSGLSSTLSSKQSKIVKDDNVNYNLYDFDEEELGTNEEASIILSLDDSDFACIEGDKSMKTSFVDAKKTHEINESSDANLTTQISNENCAKDEEQNNKNESDENLNHDQISNDEIEIQEMSFYQSFNEDKCTSDKNSETGDNQAEEDNVIGKNVEEEKQDNSLVISIDDSDSITSNHIESDQENQHENKSPVEIPNSVEEKLKVTEEESVECNNENELNTQTTSDDESVVGSLIKLPVLLHTDNSENIIIQRRKSKRGISVPPQTTNVSEDSPAAYVLERPIRHRATSLQPFLEIEEYNESPTEVGRGRVRRGSSLHDPSPIIGSPYQNTRSRVRNNSEESENDISIISQTTLRSRRQSTTSETNDVVVKRSMRKRKVSTNDSMNSSSMSLMGVDNVEKNKKTNSGSSENVGEISSNNNTILKQRRLTRQKLKEFEKSLHKNLDNVDHEDITDSPRSTRQLRGTRSTKSVEKKNDDDTSSEKSVASSTRSKRSTKSKAIAHKPLSVIIEDEPPTTPKSRTRNSKK